MINVVFTSETTELRMRVGCEQFRVFNHDLNCPERSVSGRMINVDSFNRQLHLRSVCCIETNNILPNPFQQALLVVF